MVSCEVCGSEDFEKHEGFMYCAVCQTQSQDYYEQEYEYQDHEMNVSRKQKSRAGWVKSKKQNIFDDGLWTTWEGFNYILYGMSEEMTKCGVKEEFKQMVLKLWAAYLRECQAAFTSKYQEQVPKLRFRFKQRDARILYNVDVGSSTSRKRKMRSSSRISLTSDSSHQSKRSLVVQKGKVIATDYQDYLSSSIQSHSNLADETLESLGKSSELETNEESSDVSDSLVRSFKHMFAKRDFRLYKNRQSASCKVDSKDKATKDVRFPAKNRLLSIIHLSLLLVDSQIQLSDLLRFIRESHLSFAKVTHFFPNNVKFPKRDLSYIEVISDASMPTHLRQRSITGQLAHLLKVEKIPTPDMNKLVDRYCQDLNLPEDIAKISKRILEGRVSPYTIPRSKTLVPSYEAWAMASIIFVMKLLFGLNDETEVFLSHLAHELNSIRGTERFLFVFKDWQKYIECRKSVLTTFHYPTQEQLGGSSLQSSKSFLDVLMKESKDEYRKDRFIPYPRYYIEEKLLGGVKQMLNVLAATQNVASFEFKPSLTPQTSHLEAIVRDLPESTECGVKEDEALQRPTTAFPRSILQRSFRNCDVRFAFDPENCLKELDENSDFFVRFRIASDSPQKESSEKNEANVEFLLDCPSRYWVFRYPDTASGQLCNFKEDVFEKTPENFQWLLTECARMLEMNVRDVYDELLRLELKLCPDVQA